MSECGKDGNDNEWHQSGGLLSMHQTHDNCEQWWWGKASDDKKGNGNGKKFTWVKN